MQARQALGLERWVTGGEMDGEAVCHRQAPVQPHQLKVHLALPSL